MDEELFLELREGKLVLPEKIPRRFLNRMTPEKHYFWIESMPHHDMPLRNHASLKDGIWITRDDLTYRGGGITMFGVPIQELQWPFPKNNIRVAYHGTAKENMDSIRAHSLRPTFGQLGVGIYVGSFWKACRFAGRDQKYQLRDEPLVLRVLWEEENIISFPRREECTCEICANRSSEQRQACGHLLIHDKTCGELRVGKYSTGKWITQNEEWVIPRVLRISECMELDKNTLSEVYDPLQRDIKIK